MSFTLSIRHTLTTAFRHRHRPFTVLALESSADDSCAAIVNSNRQILSNVVVKQHNVLVPFSVLLTQLRNTTDNKNRHEKFGGIYVYEAIASHQPGAIAQAISDAELDATELDGIAFTRGPGYCYFSTENLFGALTKTGILFKGMKACLSVCANAAKGIAAVLKKPLVGVHHMQAHALTPFLSLPANEHPKYPFITLLISGGHTLLLLARSPSHFITLATTVDISIGNAYDRVSHLLGIKWGSLGPGAALEKLCVNNPVPIHSFHKLKYSLPNPGELMFSYSGVLSAFQRHLEDISHDDDGGGLTEQRKAEIAWTFQHHAIEQLESKLCLGLKWCESHGHDIKHVVVSGGVASNLYLRERLHLSMLKSGRDDISLVFPPVALCTDNAAMIAWASMERFLKNDHDSYDIDLRSQWSIDDLSA